jgi:hypothetical protein
MSPLARIAALSLTFTTSIASANDTDEGAFLAEDGPRSFRKTWLDHAKPGRREPKYLRATLEQGIILGLGTAYYWIRPELNKEDWDFPDYGTRINNLTPTFDTNLHVTNNILHPASGTFYYGFARLNGLSVPVSLAYSFGSSAMFEFLLEFLEKVSINDLIQTSMGGWAPGEFFTHFSEYVHSAPKPNALHKVGGVLFGLPHHLHGIADAPDPAQPLPADNLGLSTFYWHRFDATFGAFYTHNDLGDKDVLHDFTARAQLVAIPGFLRPGKFKHPFSDGEFTEARLKMSVGDSKQYAASLFIDATLAGHYAQDIQLVNGQPRGRAWMIGVNTAYHFVDRRPFRRHDGWGMGHLLGPAFKLYALRGNLLASIEGATHFDFASIHALAYPDFVEQYGKDGTKTILQMQGYYFALGWSGWLRGTIEVGPFELMMRSFLGTYGSIDRWDRFQESVTKDNHHTDTIAELESWASVKVPKVPIVIRGFAEHIGRTSTMDPLTVHRWERRYGLVVGLRF